MHYLLSTLRIRTQNNFAGNVMNALRLTISDIEALNEKLSITEASLLNLVVSNGQQSVITRYASGNQVEPNSLYYFGGRQLVCEDNICQIITNDSDSNQAVVVASEPLTKDAEWQKVEPNHFLVIDELLNVSQQPIDIN